MRLPCPEHSEEGRNELKETLPVWMGWCDGRGEIHLPWAFAMFGAIRAKRNKYSKCSKVFLVISIRQQQLYACSKQLVQSRFAQGWGGRPHISLLALPQHKRGFDGRQLHLRCIVPHWANRPDRGSFRQLCACFPRVPAYSLTGRCLSYSSSDRHHGQLPYAAPRVRRH